jgi:putative addiction module killer protein
MTSLQEYLDLAGQNRYRVWFNELDVAAAVKATTALERLAQGNKSSIKSVGQGVSEYRIDFGPGYRIYFGRDGDRLVILLGGGSKKRQDQDIVDAKAAWQEYKHRKKGATKAAAAKQKRR